MAAKWVSKTVSAAVAPFESMGKKIGEIGMSLPKYAPIPWTGGLSMKSMEKVPMSIESAIQKHDSDKFEKSSLGKMLHADANIPPNIAKNITDAIASGERSKYEQVVKDNAAFINRPNGYNAWIIEEFMKQVQKDPTYLDTLNLSSEQKVKFKEFQGKDLKNDNTRKEAWNLWLATVGAGNTGNWEKNRTNDSWYTLEKNPITDNQLLIHLGWTTINVEQFKWKNPTEIAKIVSDGINAKKAEFTKKPINMDDLQKLFDSYGLTSAEIIAAIKKEPITNDLWQPKTGTTPEPKK